MRSGEGSATGRISAWNKRGHSPFIPVQVSPTETTEASLYSSFFEQNLEICNRKAKPGPNHVLAAAIERRCRRELCARAKPIVEDAPARKISILTGCMPVLRITPLSITMLLMLKSCKGSKTGALWQSRIQA